MKHYFYKFARLSFLFIAISFTSCEPEDDNDDQMNTCTDAEIVNYLSECDWYITDASDATVSDFAIDFSNFDIHAYDAQGQIAEEGNWSIEEGIISFNMLNQSLMNYGGDWKVIDCSMNEIDLQKGDKVITLESVCE